MWSHFTIITILTIFQKSNYNNICLCDIQVLNRRHQCRGNRQNRIRLNPFSFSPKQLNHKTRNLPQTHTRRFLFRFKTKRKPKPSHIITNYRLNPHIHIHITRTASKSKRTAARARSSAGNPKQHRASEFRNAAKGLFDCRSSWNVESSRVLYKGL